MDIRLRTFIKNFEENMSHNTEDVLLLMMLKEYKKDLPKKVNKDFIDFFGKKLNNLSDNINGVFYRLLSESNTFWELTNSNETFPFEDALFLLKNGNKVTRSHWCIEPYHNNIDYIFLKKSIIYGYRKEDKSTFSVDLATCDILADNWEIYQES